MHVVSKPLNAPAALFEQLVEDDDAEGGLRVVRVLVIRAGELTEQTLRSLALALEHI